MCCSRYHHHSCPRSLDPTSHASSTTCIYSGSVPAQRYPDLLSAMHAAISKQQALKQKEKTEGIAATGRRSHFQRTPAFIQSAVQYALKQVRRDEQQQLGGEHDAEFPPPRGGFTDVGQHTGGKPKATTWPLLQSVVKVRQHVVCVCMRFVCLCEAGNKRQDTALPPFCGLKGVNSKLSCAAM